MYYSERAFIMSFIACLSQKGVSTIKLDENYYRGLENMHRYFQENRESIGAFSNELAMLFLKNSNGDYRQFDTAIEGLNGGLLSFDNPFYAVAHLKETIEASKILNEYDKYISVEHVRGFADAFCAFA